MSFPSSPKQTPTIVLPDLTSQEQTTRTHPYAMGEENLLNPWSLRDGHSNTHASVDHHYQASGGYTPEQRKVCSRLCDVVISLWQNQDQSVLDDAYHSQAISMKGNRHVTGIDEIKSDTKRDLAVLLDPRVEIVTVGAVLCPQGARESHNSDSLDPHSIDSHHSVKKTTPEDVTSENCWIATMRWVRCGIINTQQWHRAKDTVIALPIVSWWVVEENKIVKERHIIDMLALAQHLNMSSLDMVALIDPPLQSPLSQRSTHTNTTIPMPYQNINSNDSSVGLLDCSDVDSTLDSFSSKLIAQWYEDVWQKEMLPVVMSANETGSSTHESDGVKASINSNLINSNSMDEVSFEKDWALVSHTLRGWDVNVESVCSVVRVEAGEPQYHSTPSMIASLVRWERLNESDQTKSTVYGTMMNTLGNSGTNKDKHYALWELAELISCFHQHQRQDILTKLAPLVEISDTSDTRNHQNSAHDSA